MQTARRDPLFRYPGHDLLLPDIVRVENCLLHDSGGRTYVDLESGVWCTPLGHSHPRVLRVLAEQSQRIAHTGYAYSNAVVEEAAREISGEQLKMLLSGIDFFHAHQKLEYTQVS